jgi:hypothetical protein
MGYPQVLGAITLAVDSINKDPNILNSTRLEFNFEFLSRKFNETKYEIDWYQDIPNAN